jgi:hypothetical protein
MEILIQQLHKSSWFRENHQYINSTKQLFAIESVVLVPVMPHYLAARFTAHDPTYTAWQA